MSNEKRNIKGLNVFRGIAILLMFITHIFRLQSPIHYDSASLLQNLLIFFAKIEPFTSSSFLFISGFSLILSKSRFTGTMEQWWKSKSAKYLELYIWGFILFIMEKGPQYPDMFLSPGILSAIVFGLILTALFSKNILTLGIGAIAVLAVTFITEINLLSISGINAGPGGAFPLVFFTFLGAILGKLYLIDPKSLVKGLMVLVPVSIAALLLDYPWTVTITSVYHSYGNMTTPVVGWLRSVTDASYMAGYFGIYDANYWNHTAIAAIRLAGILGGVLYSSLFWINPKNKLTTILVNKLALLGRYSLTAYIAHLVILGPINLWLNPRSPLEIWGIFIAITAFFVFFFSRMENKK